MAAGKRFLALDIFRGLTIAGMILVNMPGSWDYLYAPFHHAEWHGFTFADLIFPAFLFIMGASIWYSFASYEYRLQPALAKKIIIRSLALFGIGLFLNAYPFYMSLNELRIMGVLQRIALTYCAGAFLILLFSIRAIIITSVVILLGYWGLLIGLGGSQPFALETNLVRSVDILIIGESHLWQELGLAFDPEGLLSTLPAIVNVLIGFMAAKYIGGPSVGIRRIQMLIAGGFGIIAIGLVWALVFPINKSLWTCSYVLLSSGCSLILFGLIIELVQKSGRRYWANPFIALGSNPLIIYAFSILWANTLWMLIISDTQGNKWEGYDWVYNFLFQPWAGNYFGSLMFGITNAAIFTLIALFLHQKKIYIKL